MSNWIRYVHADNGARHGASFVLGLLEHWRCFWRGPRIGHNWKGIHGLYDECADCSKTFVGNL